MTDKIVKHTASQLFVDAKLQNWQDTITSIGATVIGSMLPFLLTALVLVCTNNHIYLKGFTNSGDLVIICPGLVVPAMILLARERPIQVNSPTSLIFGVILLLASVGVYMCGYVYSHHMFAQATQINSDFIQNFSLLVVVVSICYAIAFQLIDEVRSSTELPAEAADKRLDSLEAKFKKTPGS